MLSFYRLKTVVKLTSGKFSGDASDPVLHPSTFKQRNAFSYQILEP